jgi:hypothetical protein
MMLKIKIPQVCIENTYKVVKHSAHFFINLFFCFIEALKRYHDIIQPFKYS